MGFCFIFGTIPGRPLRVQPGATNIQLLGLMSPPSRRGLPARAGEPGFVRAEPVRHERDEQGVIV